MSKEIKDYLHLYIGQYVYIFPDDTVGGWLDDQVKKLPDLQWKIKITSLHLDEILKRGYKPILRDLSDMTDDEKIDLFRHIWPHDTSTTNEGILHCMDYIFDIEGDYGIWEYMIDKHESISTPFVWAKVTHYLLSKGFDLFGLIPAKLAINAKDLKQ